MKYRNNFIKNKSKNKIKTDNLIYSSHQKLLLLLENQKYRYKLKKQKNSEKKIPSNF